MLILLVNLDWQIQVQLQNSIDFSEDNIFFVRTGQETISIIKSFKVDMVIIGDLWSDEINDILNCVNTLQTKPRVCLFGDNNILNLYKQSNPKEISSFFLAPMEMEKLVLDIQNLKR